MKVELIDYQSNALDILLFSKNTRLLTSGISGLYEISKWSNEKKMEHLEYMKNTIQSSWEFVDYSFFISGVTRAFTHQLVRTRTGSYAQQAQRVADVRNQEVINDTNGHPSYSEAVKVVLEAYGKMIDDGVEVQRARGILPTNMTTNIMAKFNLRGLHDMALRRLCIKTQGEYRDVFLAMKEEIVKVHPWVEQFIKVSCAWNGICIFPTYSECPVQKYTINNKFDKSISDIIEEGLDEVCGESPNPKVVDGKAIYGK